MVEKLRIGLMSPDHSTVINGLGEKLHRSPRYPDIPVYIMEGNKQEYGIVEDRLVLLTGDIGTWYKYGTDFNWPDLFRGSHLNNVREITVQGIVREQTVQYREDWLGLHTTCISLDRVGKPAPPISCDRVLLRECGEKCIFSPERLYQVTPEPRISHKKTGAVSVPNLYPFWDNHMVTILPGHPSNPSGLSATHFVAMLEGGGDIEEMIAIQSEALGLYGIMNWGELGAASQGHPHVQWGGRYAHDKSLIAREMDRIEALAAMWNIDPFDAYLQHIDPSLVCRKDNEIATVLAPYAPMYPDQIDIVLNDSIPNISALDDKQREQLGKLLHETVGTWTGGLDVTDFNILIHANDFSPKSSAYRLHFHLLPRNRRKEGGSEINAGYVVDIFPETTAQKMREAFAA